METTTTKSALPLWQTIIFWLSILFLLVLGVLELIAGGYSIFQDFIAPIDRTIIYYQGMLRLSPVVFKIIAGVLLLLKKRTSVLLLAIAFAAHFIDYFVNQIYSLMYFGESWESAVGMLQVNLFFILYTLVYLAVIAFVWALMQQRKLQ